MSLVVLLFLGVDPQAVIDGPKTADLGDLVVLDAGRSTAATAFHWILVSHKKTILPVDGGKRCVFASGQPAEYRFVLVVAGADANGKLAVAVAEHAVTIGKPSPPPPIPPPQPDGPLQLAARLGIERRNGNARKPRAADSFAGIAAAIAAARSWTWNR